MATGSATWKSLFLPLQRDEHVIFASFMTALHRADSDPSMPINQFHVLNDGDTRRDTVLCVMEDQSVVTFDLGSELGPQRKCHFAAAREMKLETSPGVKPVATCASLIPLELLYACYAQSANRCAPAAACRNEERSAAPSSAHDSVVVRGVVGSSNGRVDVFTETTYAFGFPAHKCAVVSVQALFVGVDGAGSAARTASNGNASDQTSVQLDTMRDGSATATATAVVAASTSSSSGSLVDVYGSLSSLLGFLTMGADGVVFVWRRRAEGFRREKLVEPSLFSKCHAVFADFSISRQLSAARYTPGLDMEGSEDDVQQQRSPPLSPNWRADTDVYSPRVAPGVDEPDPSCSLLKAGMGIRPQPSLIYTGGNGFSNSVKVRSCDMMREVDQDVQLEGYFTRTTAITVCGPQCLVAREKVVFLVNYATKTCKRVLTATSCVLRLCLSAPIGIAGCENGKIYVFHVSTGTVLGSSYTYSFTAVESLSFAHSAMLLAVVDKTKTVEVFELSESYLRQEGTSWHHRSASAAVIHRLVQLQEGSTGGGSVAVARTASATEQLLLARFLVPEELSKYLSKQHRLL